MDFLYDKNLVLIFTGPSGAGKTTYSHMLITKLGNKCGHNITYTTRNPRKGEQMGEYFYFITEQKFQEYIERGKFSCYTWFCGNWYGYMRNDIFDVLNQSRDLIMDSIMPISQLRKMAKNVVILYLTPDSNSELKKRILCRNPEMNAHERKMRYVNMIEQHTVAWKADYIINTSGYRTKKEIFKDICYIYEETKRSILAGQTLFPEILSQYRVKCYLKKYCLPTD